MIQFVPVVRTTFPHIKRVMWGANDALMDVTDVFKSKQDTSTQIVHFQQFSHDPAPGVHKYLRVEYEDGRTQVVPEYQLLSLYPINVRPDAV